MLVRFCMGYINPDRIEAILPSAKGDGFVLATRGGNMITMVGADRNMIENDLQVTGLLKKTEEYRKCAGK